MNNQPSKVANLITYRIENIDNNFEIESLIDNYINDIEGQTGIAHVYIDSGKPDMLFTISDDLLLFENKEIKLKNQTEEEVKEKIYSGQ